MIYLASPYTSADPKIVEQRVEQVMLACASLHRQSIVVFSPIVHWHFIAKKFGLPTDFRPWLIQNHGVIDHVRALGILRLEGWRESKGVKDEVDYASTRRMPIEAYDLIDGVCVSQGLFVPQMA